MTTLLGEQSPKGVLMVGLSNDRDPIATTIPHHSPFAGWRRPVVARKSEEINHCRTFSPLETGRPFITTSGLCGTRCDSRCNRRSGPKQIWRKIERGGRHARANVV